MDAIALGEDVSLHARVPAAGLVPEMRPGFQKLFYGGCIWQFLTPFNRYLPLIS